MSGLLITFEGGEGSGKTTQIERLATSLRMSGWSVVTSREPGGSAGADAVRQVVLSGAARQFGTHVEATLFAAARADHIAALIRPALARGDIVLCDRFHDSTRVYQGLVPDADFEFLNDLEEITLEEIYPDLTFVLDLPASVGLARASERRGERPSDRFESEGVELHEARRKAFLAIAAGEPDRCIVLDASDAEATVAAAIQAHMAPLLDEDAASAREHLAGSANGEA